MYLVTGGAGFIGSNIVAALSERNDEVVVCDWLRDDERWRNLAKHEISDIIEPETALAWLHRKGHRLRAVVHMGAISATTETNVDLIASRNIRATFELLQWCTDAQVPLIFASSAATYGDGAQGFDDSFTRAALAKLRPLNAYGWSKLVVDRRLARWVEAGAKLPPQWVGLKFFNVYGPNEYHKGSMQSVVAKNYGLVRDGQPLRLFRSYRPDYADGGQLRDFVYVRDCVDVVLWLLDHPQVSGLFNLGTGQARSWLDLAKAMFTAAGLAPAIEFIDMPPTLVEKYQYFTQARMERLRSAGYDRPFPSLEHGIADYVRNYLAASDPYR
jgi:ADP-L-glycero-D-manno-heptose 6-epimerase